jgi:co-chaperonin GroES (HSP10)
MSRYEPKFGRVLIEREVKEKTTGGIILPDNAAKRHAACVGKIVALGETAGWTETYDEQGNPKTVRVFKEGQTVIFGRHSGAWLDATYDAKGTDQDDGKLFICQDADILAVIKE